MGEENKKQVGLEAELKIDPYGTIQKIESDAFLDLNKIPKNPPSLCFSKDVHEVINYLIASAEKKPKENKQKLPYEIKIKIIPKT